MITSYDNNDGGAGIDFGSDDGAGNILLLLCDDDKFQFAAKYQIR